MAEPVDGQLKKVMEQRAYTRINKAIDERRGEILAEKVDEVCEVVATQVRLAQELGAERSGLSPPPPIREASNGEEVAAAIGEAAGVEVEVLSDEEEGRLSFIGATKGLGHPVDGKIGVVDVGGGSTEIIIGTVPGGVEEVRSWRVGSGVLADELIASDPPSAAEIRKVRDRIDDIFDGSRDRASRPGRRGRRQRDLAAAPGRRRARVRDPGAGDPRPLRRPGGRRRPALRARPATGSASSPPACCCLEKVSELLGQPLQIGKGGLREGVILDLLNGDANGSSPARLAA